MEGGEEGVWPGGCLTSAALGRYVHPGALRVVHGGKVLRDSRVDAYCSVKVLLCGS